MITIAKLSETEREVLFGNAADRAGITMPMREQSTNNGHGAERVAIELMERVALQCRSCKNQSQ